MDSLSQWIAATAKRKRLKLKGLAQALGLSSTAATNIVHGKRDIKVADLKQIVSFLGEQPPLHLLGLTDDFAAEIGPSDAPVKIPVMGITQTGARITMTARTGEFRPVYAARSGKYRNARHVAFLQNGDGLEDMNIESGDTLIAIDWDDTFQILPTQDQIVVTKLMDADGLAFELSARVAVVYADRIELQARSPRATYPPIVIRRGEEDPRLTILALVIGVQRSVAL